MPLPHSESVGYGQIDGEDSLGKPRLSYGSGAILRLRSPEVELNQSGNLRRTGSSEE